jgi:hypothetical protein
MKTSILLASLLFVISCKQAEESVPSIVFEKPLPENGKNINFPKRLLGDYQNDEASTLSIRPDQIIRNITMIDTIGQSLKLNIEKNDTLKSYFKDLSFTKLSDTIYLMKHAQIDTIFNMKKGDVLRRLKGHYILNHQYEQHYYIKKLTYKNGLINIQQIDSVEMLNQLKIVTEVQKDTLFIPIKAFPTKKQFKQLIKSKGFNQGETYLKVKN